jgi:L-arabinose isomerase
VSRDRHGFHEPQSGRPRDREFGYIQTRFGVPRRPWLGTSPIPLRSAAVRRLKLARFGDNMRDVAVTEGDKVEAQLRFGLSVNTFGANDLVAVVDEVSDAEVDKLIEQYADLGAHMLERRFDQEIRWNEAYHNLGHRR